MIRIDAGKEWLLISHKEHARLAGEFARHWKNDLFAPPKPFAHILDAVTRHDDSWEVPDSSPSLTAEMQPCAFTKELVGSYDAFEEIDLPDYLKVRGEATEAAAKRDAYSAILISMHTVNLLTVQADLSGLSEEELKIHSEFIEGQIDRQKALIDGVMKEPDLAQYATEDALLAAFKFLQACDSFSLYASVAYDLPGQLQHRHPLRGGGEVEITMTPKGAGSYILSPYPLDEPSIEFSLNYKAVPKADTENLTRYQKAYAEAELEVRTITVSAE